MEYKTKYPELVGGVDRYKFEDEHGNLSEDFYDAYNYRDGFALVQKKKGGPYQFRDVNGNLSKEFYYADNYYEGFAVVRKEKDGPRQFRDTSGNLSEGFYDTERYKNGFARVKKEKHGLWQYRDMLYRLTDELTKSGEDFYLFCQGLIRLETLDDEHFLDPIFCNGVLKECKKSYLNYINEKYSENDAVDKALEVKQAKKIIAIIDAKQQAAVEKEKLKQQATSEKAQLMNELENIFDKQYGKIKD